MWWFWCVCFLFEEGTHYSARSICSFRTGSSERPTGAGLVDPRCTNLNFFHDFARIEESGIWRIGTGRRRDPGRPRDPERRKMERMTQKECRITHSTNMSHHSSALRKAVILWSFVTVLLQGSGLGFVAYPIPPVPGPSDRLGVAGRRSCTFSVSGRRRISSHTPDGQMVQVTG